MHTKIYIYINGWYVCMGFTNGSEEISVCFKRYFRQYQQPASAKQFFINFFNHHLNEREFHRFSICIRRLNLI